MTNHQFGIIEVAGPEAQKFLQGQLTIDLTLLNEKSASLAAHCNPKGRIISLFHIFKMGESYFLFLPIELIDTALKKLQKYSLFFKCKLSDESNRLVALPLETSKKPANFHIEALAVYNLDETFCLSIYPKSAVLNETLDAVYTNWHAYRIDNKIPSVHAETSEKFLPHEINLPNLGAISFNKGCFTGQEIIARMHYRSTVAKTLLLTEVAMATTPTRGSDIFCLLDTNIKACGSLIDLAQTGYNNYKALITIDAKYRDKKLFLNESGQDFNLTQST